MFFPSTSRLAGTPGDIPLLVRHFTEQFSRRMNRVIETIPSAAMDALRRYHWPGNIRELQNVIERAVIISTGPVLSVDVATLNFPRLPSGRKTRFSEIDKWRTSQRFGGNGASTDSESSQGMQLGCCRPERRSGTSCNETIHAPVENAKAWNHAWFGIAAAAILWTPLPVSITFSACQETGSLPSCWHRHAGSLI